MTLPPLTERGQLIQLVISDHYPTAHECDLCGTHLECGCDEFDYRDSDTWNSEHLARKIDDVLG